jgi:1,4-dihydroxy-2-naphthoate polyprenyltransferase
MNPYVKAVRLPFLAGSVIPVIIGATFAFEQGCFSFGFFLLSVSGITGLHLGANLLNDYFDARGSDPLNVRITPFSGGSRVIQDG